MINDQSEMDSDDELSVRWVLQERSVISVVDSHTFTGYRDKLIVGHLNGFRSQQSSSYCYHRLHRLLQKGLMTKVRLHPVLGSKIRPFCALYYIQKSESAYTFPEGSSH